MKLKAYLTYLAGPYSHPSPSVSVGRYTELTKATAWLMNEKGWNVFSPITHSHPLHIVAKMRGDWAFWKRVDTQYVKLSKRLVVLTLPGWENSIGVTAEVKIARKLDLPIFYMTKVENDNYTLSKKRP